MKRFNALTDAELLEIADNGELGKLLDLECAYQSVPLLPEMPKKPEKQEFPKDVALYVVGNFKFRNQQEALNIVEFLGGCNLVDTDGWGSKERLSELSDYNKPKVEVKHVYSKESYASIEKELADYEEAMSLYNDVESEYKRIEKQREEIETKIGDKVYEIRKEISKLDTYRTLFQRYSELAGGDSSIALNFLNNAYPDALNYPEIQDLAVEGDVKE